tara:strand:- start:316 stop:624 length:309 start_codon:yes stop_codon:yes gene_type:complete
MIINDTQFIYYIVVNDRELATIQWACDRGYCGDLLKIGTTIENEDIDNGKDRETYDNIIGFTEENHAWAWRENMEELHTDSLAYTSMGVGVDKLLSLEEAIT